MKTSDIRARFLGFFEENGHTVVPSASLISNDPTLLLVNAGMVPFKPYFTGELAPKWDRATSVQKCVRTVDIEEVGQTSRHGSFFQMCGNFSFGDYFKKKAARYAWELMTKSQSDSGFGFDESLLWVTVHTDDDEAHDIWANKIGIDSSRIQRLGKDNFWDMGVPGPCGPSSEIFVDRGAEFGPDGGPETGGDRFVELWNLVFMQFERGASEAGAGKGYDFPILGDLPAKNIDTGLGLERVATQLQGVDNLFEIDEVYPVLDRAAALSGKKYGADHEDDVRLRVVADHVRTGLMLMADGVTPANDGRGYVLRRMLRRAVRSMRLLGYDDPAFPELFSIARDSMKSSYAEVDTDYERISDYAYAEEEQFASTLRAGTTIFDTAVADTKRAGGSQVSGDKAFQLHDTYGFPIDLTLEMAAEQGISVDEDGFRRLMGEQRDRAKADAAGRKLGGADSSAYRKILDTSGTTTFTGYAEIERESRVAGLIRAGQGIRGAGEGEEIEIVLDSTPFYAEGGGQQPDNGIITIGDGQVEIFDVQSPLPGLIVHRGRVLSGEVTDGSSVLASVDINRRRAISRAHTATHLIHQSVRAHLGESATQAGSLNAPGRLRFDFLTPGAVPASVLADVEEEVNAILMDDLEVRAFLTTQQHAREIGAMALFGEKYGDTVRVVEVGDYARELCGGTHAARSGQLGMVKLLSEASIGSGVRRVEALVGLDAFQFLAREHVLVAQLAESFKVPADEVPDRVASVVEKLKAAEKEIAKLKSGAILDKAADYAAGATDVFGVSFVGVEGPPGLAGNDLRSLALDIRGRIPADRPAVVAATTTSDKGASFIVATNDKAREWRLGAGEIIKVLAEPMGGRGGGKDDIAQGGGTNAAGAAEGLRRTEHWVGQRVTGSL
ncbi:alanyl-tRNA synthetase [Antricoccus suffuscus]|uniref:Alanine--tRNA ligase n=1 Tax=Antricoccus suffuscus TaxID=1629062 RepID=A0A2T0ZW94_9ACTN|nr:alanine--tRNA ligase [Antricoccus suffuscus]PRZ40631.1 alanyl-tRNA synthetase [Antricoccus suffuscus]